MEDNFIFIIGAQRSGTTYLYHILDTHPQIQMAKPVSPEPKFFLKDAFYNKGKEFYIEKYFLNQSKGVKVFGEKSTSYIENDYVGKRIKSFFPNAKILVILRNPVERAISNYYFSLANCLEKRSIEEVFIDEIAVPEIASDISVSPFKYLERGCYTDYLQPFIEIFKERLKVLIFEECVGNPQAVSDIYRFAGVDDEFIPANINQIVNDSKKDNNIKAVSQIKEKLRKYYLPKNRELEKLLKRNISIWDDKI